MALATRVTKQPGQSRDERTVEFYDVDTDIGVAAITFNTSRQTPEQIDESVAHVLTDLTVQWTDLLASS